MTNNALNSLIEDYDKEPEYQKLISYIMDGWPEDERTIPEKIKHFSNFKEELSTYNNIIYKCQKIVVPEAQTKNIIRQAHAGHLGQHSTISLIRNGFYWKSLDK